MFRLAAVLYILVASALAGAAVAAVLSLGLIEAWQVGTAFVAGCLLAVPVALILARRILYETRSPVA